MTSIRSNKLKKSEPIQQTQAPIGFVQTRPLKRRGGRDREDQSLVAVDFCGVSMLVPKPTKVQRQLRIAEGMNALAKLAKILAKPGVKLALSKDHPIYVADKRDPSLVIQTIGKISRRGRFDAKGRFVEVK